MPQKRKTLPTQGALEYAFNKSTPPETNYPMVNPAENGNSILKMNIPETNTLKTGDRKRLVNATMYQNKLGKAQTRKNVMLTLN